MEVTHEHHARALTEVLVLVEGEATVCGDDVVRRSAGEEHETVARSRVVAIVVE